MDYPIEIGFESRRDRQDCPILFHRSRKGPFLVACLKRLLDHPDCLVSLALVSRGYLT